MNFRIPLLVLALMGSAGLLGTVPAAWAAADAATVQKQKQDYETRVTSVKALTDALKRESQKAGISSADTIATVEARSKEAEGLAAAGEYDVARSILDEGYRTLTMAIAKLENAKGQGGMTGMTGMAGTVDPKAASARQRELVERDIASTRSLIDALKRQNADKGAGKAADIARIEADTQQAQSLLAGGKVTEADALIDDAYARAKGLIAALQKGAPAMTGMSGMSGMSGMADPAYAAKREREMVERDISSTRSLIDALKRQNADKGAGKGSELARIETDTQQAEALLAAGKVAEADRLIDDAYARAKAAIAGMQKASGMKTGSAALESNAQREMSGMSAAIMKNEFEARLKSVAALRDALKRRNPGAAEIARADQMTGEATRLAPSNPDKAMAMADEAYEMVKAAIKR